MKLTIRVFHVLAAAFVLVSVPNALWAADGETKKKGGSSARHFVLLASMPSEVIAALDLDSGEVTVLHHFSDKQGPKGIAMDSSGNLYVSVRYGGKNVLKLIPKKGERGFQVESFTGQFGRYGPGKLRMQAADELFIAGDSMGMIYRYQTRSGREGRPMAAKGMSSVLGLDVRGNDLYAVEIFGLKLVKFALDEKNTNAQWLSLEAEKSLKRSSGITIGPDGNILITNTQKSTISEFSTSSGKFTKLFFDLKSVGISSASDICYASALNAYLVAAGGVVVKLDAEGKLLQKYALGKEVKGASAIMVVDEKQLPKALADQL